MSRIFIFPQPHLIIPIWRSPPTSQKDRPGPIRATSFRTSHEATLQQSSFLAQTKIGAHSHSMALFEPLLDLTVTSMTRVYYQAGVKIDATGPVAIG